MKIKRKYLNNNTKVWHPILNKYFLIEEGKEELYMRLGFDHIFTKPQKPKLQKSDKTTKRRSNNVRSNRNRTNNDK